MNKDLEVPAFAVIVVFGALTLGGLMAAALAFGDRDGFFFALGSSAAAWASGYAMVFERHRIFLFALTISVLLALTSVIAIA